MQTNEEQTDQQTNDAGGGATVSTDAPATVVKQRASKKKASKKKASKKKGSKKKASKKKASKKKASKKKASKKKASKKKASKKKTSKKKASKKKTGKKKASKKKASKKKASKKRGKKKKAAAAPSGSMARVLAAAEELRDALQELAAQELGNRRRAVEELRDTARAKITDLENAAQSSLARLTGKG